LNFFLKPFQGVFWVRVVVPYRSNHVRHICSHEVQQVLECNTAANAKKCAHMCCRLCFATKAEGTKVHIRTKVLHTCTSTTTSVTRVFFLFSFCLQFMCSCSQFSSILKPWPWLLLPTLWLHPLLPWLLNKIHPLCN
jgi:hypothetical protein